MADRSAQNWSGHIGFSRTVVHEPTSVGELQERVADADRVGVIGSRHSFNDVADTTGDLFWLGRLNPNVHLDRDRMTASFGAGMTYGELAAVLHDAGLALANTASFTSLTVVGACATGTHGSGDGLGGLATAVAELEMVCAGGSLITLVRGRDHDFDGAVVALGALGIVSRLTVDVEPAFDVRQHCYVELPFEDLYANFDEVTSAGYSVSLFTTFQRPSIETVYVKQRVADTAPSEPKPTLFGARHVPRRTLPTRADRVMTEFDVPGPWHERLPHFGFIDPMAEGTELQSEYFVAREHAVDAIRAVVALGPAMADILEISEIRTVAADRLWLSPAYGHDVVAIHFNWFKDAAGVEAFLPVLEAALAPFTPRPHWGKLFALSRDRIEAGHPRLHDFRELRATLDPDGKFLNRYLRAHVVG